MSENPTEIDEQLRVMQQRLDLLERENQRLREKLEPIVGPDSPWFDLKEFRRVLRRIMVMGMSPMWLGMLFPLLILMPSLRSSPIFHQRIGPVPVIDIGGTNAGIAGVGLGLVAFGGGSVGVVSFGGFSLGLIAFGGCSVGLIAIGGGSIGLIAVGGGACGYIAVGGAVLGYYGMADQAHGKFVLARNRQDDEAIEFFVRYIRGLRRAVTLPMPVILLEPNRNQSAATINSQPASRTSA